MKLRIDSLLLLVAAAGYIATSGAHIDPVRFGLLMLAGFLGAAGASATNHYLDRDLDLVMHRTRTRPLPQRRIEPRPMPSNSGSASWSPGSSLRPSGSISWRRRCSASASRTRAASPRWA